MHEIITSLLTTFGDLGYTGIFILMAMESSIFPVPSEAVMIPAGYLASKGQLDIFLTILTGGVGSLFGAIVNYFVLGQLIGKPFLMKYGKYVLITKEKYQKAENLFVKNDKLYTFLGRFIPVVRHLISIPAGIFKMNFLHFCILTFVGATIWSGILVLIGYYFGAGMVELFSKYTGIINIIIVVVLIIGIYKFTKGKNKNEK